MTDALIDEHLFRREAGRMVAALTRIFGVHNLALAEDVVQDALCRALEVWKFHGVPENPGAWLMTTAKNRALDVVRRERRARELSPELGRLLETEWTLAPVVAEMFAQHEIEDDVLRMMFTCCNPRVAEETQVALVLNVVSGFAAPEIAHAFLTSTSAIEKRLSRGKASLAETKTLFDFAGASDLGPRLDAVHRALYVLFSEGYHGAHPESAVRTDLCAEAIRLVEILAHHAATSLPETHALAALMLLHGARLPGRVGASGDLSPLVEQDRSRWDRTMIERGIAWLERSATGNELSEYHLEAAIAAEHASAPRAEDTSWARIAEQYEMLYAMRPTPIVALNRAIAIAQRDGPERGLEAIDAIEGASRLEQYPFYFAARGELELRAGRTSEAREHFERARKHARNPEERRFFDARIRNLRDG